MTVPLPTRRLGKTKVTVPTIGFGAASLGNLYKRVSDEEARSAITHAYAQGLRYFDTAPYYGFGLSERRVGDALRDLDRSSFVISTKVGRLLVPDHDVVGYAERYGFHSNMPFSPTFDYTYDGIMRSIETSLQRLGLSRIDIALVHDIGKMTHGDQANRRYWEQFRDSGYRALDILRADHSIGAVGLGVNETQVCEDAMEIGQFDCFLLAGRYSLLEQDALDTFLPKCRAHGASVIAGGIYNSGILATGIRGDGPIYYNYEPAPPEIVDRVARIEHVCKDHDVKLIDAALQFPLAHPQVSCVIPGMGSRRRVDSALAQLDAKIPESFWSDLTLAGLLDTRAPLP